LFGAGLTASFNTRLGPIGITTYANSGTSVRQLRDLGLFINFGFWL